MHEARGPKRWFRSRGFGLGLPGLMFLLWAWGDSGDWSTGMVRSFGGRVLGLHQEHGQLLLVFDEDRSGSPGSGWQWTRELIGRKAERFGPFPRARGVGRMETDLPGWGYRLDRLLLAHWLLLIGYVVLWLGTLALWQRWRRRRWLRTRKTAKAAASGALEA